MEQQQESQKASRKRSSSTSRKHPAREGVTGGDRDHPHSLEGKSTVPDSEAEQISGHGNSAVAKIPLQKSVSEKGSSEGNKRASDQTLDGLAEKLVGLIKQTEDGVLDLDGAMATLKVNKMLMDEVTDSLEGPGLIENISNNRIRWKVAAGFPRSREEKENISSLQEEIGTLKIEESTLDERIREMQERLRNVREDANNQSRLYFTGEDILNLPCFRNEILIVIKAPQGTRIEVPHPDEDDDVQERRYTLLLRSNKGAINLWLISPYKEIQEITNPDGGAQPSIPETSRANENVSVSPITEIRERIGEADASPQRDCWTELFNVTTDDNADGNMRPPDWYMSIEALADLWEESEHLFDFVEYTPLGNLLDFSSPPVQPPPSANVMPSTSDMIAEIEWNCWKSTDDDYTAASTSTPQDQTLLPMSTATPYVSNTTADIDRYNLEMVDTDNAIASISTPQAKSPPPINTTMPSKPNTTADISRGRMKMIHNDNVKPGITTAQAQPQTPTDTAMPFADIGWDMLKAIHEDNVTASIKESQAQTPPKVNTGMPSVSNALPHMVWDSMEMTHENNALANISAPQAQTLPPINTAMPVVSNMITNTEWDSLKTVHENNTMTNTNTTQAQTTQPSATAMSSVSKTTGSNNEPIMRSMAEVSPNSEAEEITPVAHERGPTYKVYKRRAKAQVKRDTVGQMACGEKE